MSPGTVSVPCCATGSRVKPNEVTCTRETPGIIDLIVRANDFTERRTLGFPCYRAILTLFIHLYIGIARMSGGIRLVSSVIALIFSCVGSPVVVDILCPSLMQAHDFLTA